MSDRHAVFRPPRVPGATTASTGHADAASGRRSYRSRLVDASHPSVFRAASGDPTRRRRGTSPPDGATIHQLDARRPVEPPHDPVA